MLRAIIVERADCAAMENVIEWLRGSGFARAETALWGGKTVKHLNRSIMEDYEIISSRPERLCAVQFGADARLLGGVDRLLDDANRAGANVGAALVDVDGGEFAGHLKRQDGMFTVFVRGEADEKEIHREQVVQSVLRALDPEADDAALMRALAPDTPRFVCAVHRNDFLYRACETELKAMITPCIEPLEYDHEPMQYLLIDGVFSGAAVGHFRNGPYDLNDVVGPEALEARRDEILAAVRAVNFGASPLRFRGMPL